MYEDSPRSAEADPESARADDIDVASFESVTSLTCTAVLCLELVFALAILMRFLTNLCCEGTVVALCVC